MKKSISASLILIGIILFALPYLNLQRPIIISQDDPKKTTGWKEYKSSEYHFSFKYPEGLLSNFSVNSTGPIDVTLKQLESTKISKKSFDPSSYNVFFEANGWKFEGTIEEFIHQNLQIKKYKQQMIKLGNVEGLRVSNLEEQADAYYYYNFFKHGNYIYNFAIFADNAEEVRGNSNLLNEIIATLKFH